MRRRTSITHVPTFGSLFLLFVSSGSCLHAQTVAPLCTPTDYKIVSLAIITIQCDEDVSQLVGEAQLLDAASGPGKPLVSSIPVTPYEEATQWLILNLGAGSPAMPAGAWASIVSRRGSSHVANRNEQHGCRRSGHRSQQQEHFRIRVSLRLQGWAWLLLHIESGGFQRKD